MGGRSADEAESREQADDGPGMSHREMIPVGRSAQQQDKQDAEKARQLRSRLIEILNVPSRARLRFRFSCGFAGRTF